METLPPSYGVYCEPLEDVLAFGGATSSYQGQRSVCRLVFSWNAIVATFSDLSQLSFPQTMEGMKDLFTKYSAADNLVVAFRSRPFPVHLMLRMPLDGFFRNCKQILFTGDVHPRSIQPFMLKKSRVQAFKFLEINFGGGEISDVLPPSWEPAKRSPRAFM